MTSKRDCYETKRNIVEARQKYIMFSLICYHWLPSKKQAKCIIIDIAQTDFAYLCTPNSKNIVSN